MTRRIFILITFISALAFLAGHFFQLPKKIKEVVSTPRPTPLAKYSFTNLANFNFKPGKITINNNLFTLEFNPNLDGKTLKKTTGLINIPTSETENTFPIIVMFRGFVDQKIYQTGVGTKHAADYYAKNGFITIAPDFLGYAGSDSESSNIFESRFQTYVTAISLIKSLSQITQWDQKNIFIWGHSNGGQIALTVQEIIKSNYPTVLWAPVSKPFPYSILYYTDEAEDKGKLIRTELAKFEQDYNVENFSLNNFLANIVSPMQIHQGTADDAVPVTWTDALAKTLKTNNVEVSYFKYPGADHNLQPGWDTVVQRDVEFFNKFRQN